METEWRKVRLRYVTSMRFITGKVSSFFSTFLALNAVRAVHVCLGEYVGRSNEHLYYIIERRTFPSFFSARCVGFFLKQIFGKWNCGNQNIRGNYSDRYLKLVFETFHSFFSKIFFSQILFIFLFYFFFKQNINKLDVFLFCFTCSFSSNPCIKV